MGSIQQEIDTDLLLSKLTLKEKVSLLAAVDWWRTPVIKRDGVFVPHIKVCFFLLEIICILNSPEDNRRPKRGSRRKLRERYQSCMFSM